MILTCRQVAAPGPLLEKPRLGPHPRPTMQSRGEQPVGGRGQCPLLVSPRCPSLPSSLLSDLFGSLKGAVAGDLALPRPDLVIPRSPASRLWTPGGYQAQRRKAIKATFSKRPLVKMWLKAAVQIKPLQPHFKGTAESWNAAGFAWGAPPSAPLGVPPAPEVTARGPGASIYLGDEGVTSRRQAKPHGDTRNVDHLETSTGRAGQSAEAGGSSRSAPIGARVRPARPPCHLPGAPVQTDPSDPKFEGRQVQRGMDMPSQGLSTAFFSLKPLGFCSWFQRNVSPSQGDCGWHRGVPVGPPARDRAPPRSCPEDSGSTEASLRVKATARGLSGSTAKPRGPRQHPQSRKWQDRTAGAPPAPTCRLPQGPRPRPAQPTRTSFPAPPWPRGSAGGLPSPLQIPKHQNQMG